MGPIVRNTQNSARASKIFRVAVWAAAGISGLAASTASADNLFDFTHDPIDPVRMNPPLVAGFTPAPFLRNDNAGAVGTYLNGQAVKAVKIELVPVTGL